MPGLSKSARIITVVLTALLLQACSAIRLVYNQAPELLYWQLDGYVDFTSAQTPRVRDELAALMLWHRQEQMPRYAQTLAQAQALLQSTAPVQPDQVCAVLQGFQATLPAFTERFATGSAWLPASMTPAQFTKLQAKWAEGDTEFREEWLDADPKEVFDRRLTRFVERSETFYGRLSPAQRELLKEHVAASPFDPSIAWAERQRRQQDLLAAVRQSAAADSDAQRAAPLTAWANRALQPPEPAARAHLQANLRHACVGIARLHNSTTEAQRTRALGVLKNYERDALELASAVPVAAK
jgi:hypothetical protein